MKFFCWLIALCVPQLVFCQYSRYVGINFTPTVLKTYEFRYEQRIRPGISLEGGIATRIQNRELGKDLLVGAFEPYVAKHNFGIGAAAGVRLYNWDEYEYPYWNVMLTTAYFNEGIVIEDTLGAPISVDKQQGMRLGLTSTLGMVLNLPGQFKLDVGIQAGYTPPRKAPPLNYYLPAFGYNTYGGALLAIPGLHLQPVLTLKYDLVRDKHDEIKKQE